jgi:hypothetical protein
MDGLAIDFFAASALVFFIGISNVTSAGAAVTYA